MKIRYLILVLLLSLFMVLSRTGTLWCQQGTFYQEEFKIESFTSISELSTLVGIKDMLKIPVQGENISLTLKLHVYRTEEIIPFEEVTQQPVEPVEKRPVGTIFLRTESAKPHILLVVQELLIHGEREMILHWGLGEQIEDSHKLSHSRILLDVEEKKDPSYHWSYGLFHPEAPEWDTPFPIYVFRGLKQDTTPVVFRSGGSIHEQAQLHHVLVVVNFQLTQGR